jgi:hypothetical protein
MASSNVINFNNSNPFVGAPPLRTVFDSDSRVPFPEATSPSAPAIAALGKGLYLCWRRSGNDQINVLGAHQGTGLRITKNSVRTTEHHPAIAEYRRR